MKPRLNRTTTLTALLLLVFLGLVIINSNTRVSRAQAQVTVTAANPSSTSQGTANLVVKVTGKGFKSGAKAQWFVTGTTDSGGVTVNSTAFVSSTEVDANITVADTATISNFDIAVINSDGRGGKGTELFAVTAKGNQVLCPAQQPAPTSDTKCYAASPGCLDTAFGSGVGFVHTDPDTSAFANSANAMAVQPDGKIVVVGTAEAPSSSNDDFVVLRYNADGSLDTSFGDPDPLNPSFRLGYTITVFSTAGDWARSVVVQSDGKIIVGGGNGANMEMARYNSEGTLDATFGSSGKVSLNFGKRTSFDAYGLALQSDGKIVAGGPGGGFGLARFNINGTLDSTFGNGGWLIANPGTGGASARTIAIQRIPAITGEERIVVGGYTITTSGSTTIDHWTLMRFRANGATDTSFGINGVVTTGFYGFSDVLYSLGIDSNNRIVGSGSTRSASLDCGSYVGNVAVARYSQDGALDTTFAGGKQIIDVYGGGDSPYGLAIQADGKIVVSETARSSDQTVTHFALIRFNADGTRDSSFGLLGNGTVTTDLYGTESWATGGVALQPADGKIVVAGSAYLVPKYSDGQIVVARYWP